MTADLLCALMNFVAHCSDGAYITTGKKNEKSKLLITSPCPIFLVSLLPLLQQLLLPAASPCY
jgi:hypothetical protein